MWKRANSLGGGSKYYFLPMITSPQTTITVGFRAKYIIIFGCIDTSGTVTVIYDEERYAQGNGYEQCNTATYYPNLMFNGTGELLNVTDTQIFINPNGALGKASRMKKMWLLAVG